MAQHSTTFQIQHTGAYVRFVLTLGSNAWNRNGGGAPKSTIAGEPDLRPVTIMAAAVTNSSVDFVLKTVAEAYGDVDDV